MITEIYAIEISGICDMSCSYCTYRLNKRTRGLMTNETLDHVIEWIRAEKVKCSNPIFLHLFGEPLLHPEFIEMAWKIKEIWPRLSFSTNGRSVNGKIAEKLSKVGFEWITISPHDPKTAAFAYYILKAKGNQVWMHAGPDHNWAGQIKHDVKWHGPCEFERDSKAVVRWNGDIAACCISDCEQGVMGTVFDDAVLDEDIPIMELCKTCHLKRERI